MEKDNKTFLELLKEIKKFNKIDLIAQAFQVKYAKETAGEDDDQRKKDANKTNELLGEILTSLDNTKEEEKSQSITGATSPNILNTPEEILAHESKKQTVIFNDLFEISEKSLNELRKISLALTGDKTPASLFSKRSAAGAGGAGGAGSGGTGGGGSFLGSLLGGAAGGGAVAAGAKAAGVGKAASAAGTGGLFGGIKGAMAGGGGAALSTAALIAAPFAANAIAKTFGVGGEASYLDPFKGIDNKQADENFKKMSFVDKAFTTLAAGIEDVGSFIAPNIANEARADRIKKQTKYLALTEGERELKEKDPKTFAKYEEFTKVRTKEYSYDLAKSQGRQTPNEEDIKAAESRAKAEASQRFSQEIEAAGIKPSKVKPAPVTKKSEVVPPKDVPGSSVKKAVTGAPASPGSKPQPSYSNPPGPDSQQKEYDKRVEEKLSAYDPKMRDDVSVRRDAEEDASREMNYTPSQKRGGQTASKEEPVAPKKTVGTRIGEFFGFGDKKEPEKVINKNKENEKAARGSREITINGMGFSASQNAGKYYLGSNEVSKEAFDNFNKAVDTHFNPSKHPDYEETYNNALKRAIEEKKNSPFGYDENGLTDRKFAESSAENAAKSSLRGQTLKDVFRTYEARQSGGPMTEGKPYLVGETGPEVIVPNKNGEVVSNSELNSSLNEFGFKNKEDFDSQIQNTDVQKTALTKMKDKFENEILPEMAPLMRHLNSILPEGPNEELTKGIAEFAEYERFYDPSEREESINEAYVNLAAIEKKQAGGPVTEGKPYLVGETGPEVVVPKETSTVVPKNKKAAKSKPQIVETKDLGGGTKQTVYDDGSYAISDGEGTRKYGADDRYLEKTSPTFSGFSGKEDMISGETELTYAAGPIYAKRRTDREGKILEESESYDFGHSKVSSTRKADGTATNTEEIRQGGGVSQLNTTTLKDGQVQKYTEENIELKDKTAAGRVVTPIVMNNVSNNNTTTYIPIKGEPRPGSRGSALDRYNDRTASYI